MEGRIKRYIAAQRPFSAFNNSVSDFVLFQRSLYAGMTIMSPKVLECFDLPMGTMTGSFQRRCPKFSKKNKYSVDNRNVSTFRSATVVCVGGMHPVTRS